MSQTFFKLTHHDWVECFTKLNRSELGVLFYLRTLNPFGDRRLKINCQAIGEILDIHRTSVSRALKKLEGQKFIELEIVSAQVKLVTNDNDIKQKAENVPSSDIDRFSEDSVHPRTERASTHGSVHPRTERCAPTHGSVHPRTESVHPRTVNIPETPPDKGSKSPQTLQTYTDFKDSLSEGERENFFNFVQEKTNNLEKPINDLEAWLASKNAAKQNRWEIYYKNYQEEKKYENIRTTKQGNNQGNYSPSKLQRAIAEFKKQRQINQPVDEPENENSEEDRQRQAEFNKLLDNPPEKEKSQAQQRREKIAEIKQQQQELDLERKRENAERQRQQELDEPDPEKRKAKIIRDTEEFLRNRQQQNPEIGEENLENE